jgi:hypothetical protein
MTDSWPDYNQLRAQTPFSWSVGSSSSALLRLTGISIKEFNLNPAAGIEAYRKGRPLLRDLVGPDVALPAPATPPVSYGHIHALGAELIFPEDGEVNHSTLCHSLEAGIEILKQPIDYAKVGMFPFFLDYREKLQTAFPGESVNFSMGYEGPLTTAYTLRRDAFFYDPYDNPAQTKEFLRLIVASVLDYCRFLARLNGRPAIEPDSAGICDDISSMIQPAMWPEFVIPFINQYFTGRTTGTRVAHIEDLRPEHLPFLEELGLVYFDPSISPKINPKMIDTHCRVPFGWRLGSFHFDSMNVQDVQDFVFQAVADGACKVFTYVADLMCSEETLPKVQKFIATGKTVSEMLQRGATRTDVAACVSPEGKQKFWAHWPE